MTMHQAAVIDTPSERLERQRAVRRKFVTDNLLATASTLVAGLLGFALQAISSHELHPAEFGKVSAVVGFYTLVTRPSSAFGRLQAWHTSRELSTDSSEELSGVLLRLQTIRLMEYGSLVTLGCIALGTVLGPYLHVSFWYVAAGAVSIPFLLAVQPLLGSLQGEQRFVLWSILSIVVNLSRLVLVVAFIAPLFGFGAVLGNTVASIVTFSACLAGCWKALSLGGSSRRRFSWRPVMPLMVTGFAATFAIGVYQGADVILVEHFFKRVPAGQYAAVATVASAVFFVSGGVASAVFPKVAERHAQGQSTVGVMTAAFGFCALAGTVGTAFLQVVGREVLLDFAGRRYTPGAHYLGLYAVSMALLAWVVVLVNTQQSLNKMSLLWILVPATVLRPLLIYAFHGSLMTVVVVSIISLTLFSAVLTVVYLVTERKRLHEWGDGSGSSLHMPAAGA